MSLPLKIDRLSSVSLNYQIYEQIRDAVLSGKLKAGDKLPSGRDLAEELLISRPTVSAALEQLEKEGYICIKQGSGVYVSDLNQDLKDQPRASEGRNRLNQLSAYGKFVQKKIQTMIAGQEPEIAFYCWRPAVDQFPTAEWARILGKHARSLESKQLDEYSDAQGKLELRTQIAELVSEYRQLKCDPGQVLITMGLNQGLEMISRLHLEAGCTAVLEEPGYHYAKYYFECAGAKVLAAPLDDDGLKIDLMYRKIGPRNVKLIYLTPSHQFPTGITMSLARRLEILRWAQEQNAFIIEDDYDSEYQASGRPIPALMSLDKTNRVIYAGTLNQLMFPALGLGYLILPSDLIPAYSAARKMAGEQVPEFLQSAIAEFIRDGHLDRHVKRLRPLYAVRREHLISCLEKYLGSRVEIQESSAGVFLLVRLSSKHNSEATTNRALAAGVGLTPTSIFYQSKPPDNEFILGFGNLNEEQIEEGVKRLSKIL